MTKKLKHILVLPRWYPNKTDIQLGVFIRQQLKLIIPFYNVSVIYAQSLENTTEKYSINKVEGENFTEVIVYFKQDKSVFRKVINAFRYQKAQKIGLKELNRKNFDLTHVHVPYRSAFLGLKFKKKQQTPLLITEHWSGHLNGEYHKKNKLDQYVYKYVLSKANQITTVSKTLQTQFKLNTGFDSIHIPNLIEESNISFTSSAQNKLHILTVSDLYEKTKNSSDLLIAFSLFLEIYPETKLTIIGGGPDAELLARKISDLKIPRENIEMSGRLPHEMVLEAMHQCDFYICNSNTETFGMTVAEALICGKPVISTTCGGPEEFITESNGILIESGLKSSNSTLLFNAMLEMTEKLNTYNKQEIAANIRTLYGKEAVLKKWQTIYEANFKQ